MHPRVITACLAAALAAPAIAQGVRIPQAQTAAPAAPAARSQAAGPQAADYIVAVVNSEPITRNELTNRTERLRRQLAADGASLPSADVLEREVLERLVLERVQLQFAREAGVTVDDLAVAQAEDGVARQNSVSKEAMYRQLAADGISPAQFRRELRNQLVLQRLREREVTAGVKVTEFDIDQYLREQQQQRGGDDRGQVGRRHETPLRTRRQDRLRDAACTAFFTKRREDSGELSLRRSVDEVEGR